MKSFLTGILLALFIPTLSTKLAWGAACCARNSAAPFLILGDDKAQIGFGYSQANIVAKADREGFASFTPSSRSESIQSMRADGALLLSDLWQAGISVPLLRNQLSTTDISGSSTGIGDVRLSLGYEFLPSWTYSAWKPQGFLFSVITLPTGRSPYESLNSIRTDITGNGFFSAALGTILFKRWTLFDVFVLPEVHYSAPRTFQSFGTTLRAVPGFGASFGIGLGYSPGAGSFRLGLRIQPRVDQGVYSEILNSPFASQSANQGGTLSSCDTGLDLSYMLSDQNTMMVSYTDQTLLGVALNTNLNRMVAFNFQHRWQR